MSGRFYKVTIGDIVLSSNGENNGLPCKLSVEGVEDLLTTVAGVAVPSITGAPVFQMIPWTSGKQFDIKIETHIYVAQWNALKTLLNDSLASGTSFTVIGTGEIGDFNVNARAFPQKPFSASGFENGRIEKAVFRLITI